MFSAPPHLPLSIIRLFHCLVLGCSHPYAVLPTTVSAPCLKILSTLSSFHPAANLPCIPPVLPAFSLVTCWARRPPAALFQHGQINHAPLQQAIEDVPFNICTNAACPSQAGWGFCKRRWPISRQQMLQDTPGDATVQWSHVGAHRMWKHYIQA